MFACINERACNLRKGLESRRLLASLPSALIADALLSGEAGHGDPAQKVALGHEKEKDHRHHHGG